MQCQAFVPAAPGVGAARVSFDHQGRDIQPPQPGRQPEAAVPGVQVEATNTATGVSASATTNAAGNYIIPFLSPGTYRVTAEAAGFKGVQKSADGDYGPGLGIHEMGTARMGRDPKTSVLNAHNQMWECKNVFITDGAAMTSASCVNPSLTYMALTARAAAFAAAAGRKGEL